MSMLTALANMVGIGGGGSDAVARARETLATAERERSEAARRLEKAAAALSEAEQAYDESDTDANGERVIKARQERDLASLKAERAQRREDDARRALGAAERAADVAKLEAALEDAHRQEAEASRAEEQARAARAASHPAAKILALLEAGVAAGGKARADEDIAREMRATLRRQIAELEASIAGLDPQRGEALRVEREQREKREREAFGQRLTLAAVKAEIAPDVAIVVAAERLAIEARARIDAAIDRQRCEAARALELGLDVAQVHEGHKRAHVEHARHLAAPLEGRNGGKLMQTLADCFGVQLVGAFSTQYAPAGGPYLSEDDLTAFYLDTPHPEPSTLRALAHRRALEARDVNALAWEASQRREAPAADNGDDDQGDDE